MRDLASPEYLRSIGVEEKLIPSLVEQELAARQQDVATKAQTVQELASLAWGAVNAGELTPHDAYALLREQGQPEAAEAFHRGWDAVDAASNLEDGLAVLRNMSASEHREYVAAQRAQAERDAYAARYAETEAQTDKLLQAGLDAAKGYGALTPQVVDRFSAKLAGGAIAGELTPDAITREVHTAGREVAVAADRLESLTEQARVEFRIRSREDARTGRSGAITSSDRKAAERAYIEARTAQLAAENQLTPEDLTVITSESEHAATVARVEKEAAFDQDFRANAFEAEQRGRALEAERKRPRNLLAGRFGNPPNREEDEVVLA